MTVARDRAVIDRESLGIAKISQASVISRRVAFECCRRRERVPFWPDNGRDRFAFAQRVQKLCLIAAMQVAYILRAVGHGQFERLAFPLLGTQLAKDSLDECWSPCIRFTCDNQRRDTCKVFASERLC